MPYSITIDDARHYISIAITSQVTMDERGAALRDVVALLETTGYKCVLVDFRNGATLAATAAVKQRHATELARQYTARFGVRLAYVSKSTAFDENAVESLAAAYGYFYERFTDVDRALQWLVD